MKSYLISVPLGDPAPAGVRHSAHTQDYNNGTEDRSLWDCINPTDPTPGNAYLIGAWDMGTGDLLSPLHDDFFLGDVRPLGNLPEQVIYDEQGEPVDVIPPGLATKHLRYAYWDTAGMEDRKLDQGGKLYPADNQPFPGHMVRMHWTEISHANKYGWQFELDQTFDETLRNPAQVFISIFSDANCTQFLYQVGAMYKGTSAFQVDEEGNPVEVWLQNNFGTQNTLEPTDIHFAICNGHYTFHEGRASMVVGEDKEEDLFWKDNQPNQGTLIALSKAWAKGGKNASSSDVLTHGQEVAIYRHMLKLGFDPDELQVCDMFNGGTITAKEAALRLLQCIATGAVTAPAN